MIDSASPQKIQSYFDQNQREENKIVEKTDLAPLLIIQRHDQIED